MKYFFDKGLRFQCQRCGDCCTIPDGYVYIYPNEIFEISAKMDMSVEKFRNKYMTKIDDQDVLKSFPNGECIFYTGDNGCHIYEFRPRQCRTFPFWPHNLRSPDDWQNLSKECPGVDKGRLFTKEEIIKRIHEKLRRD
ncbi:MAG: YkgJ family cysteine cluster protein [Candidatus Zixiibacteriota bacterium]